MNTLTNEIVFNINNLNVWYGEKQALKNVNLNILKNKITAFIGPSGCGKTTLLKCLNRMNDIINSFSYDGEIFLNGEDVNSPDCDVIHLRKKVGMVFQQPNPLPTSIKKNLLLPIKEHYPHLSKSEIDEIIYKRLKDAHIFDEVSGRLNESALRLSGGQLQRLSIARALTIDPEIILFDEPCSALDPISTMKIEELLLELKEKYTIIIVTHNLQQAVRISDYAAFFYQGEIIENSTASELFINPKQELTQKYISGKF